MESFMNTTTELLAKPINEYTPEELAMVQDTVLIKRQRDFDEKLKELQNEQRKTKARLDEIEQANKENTDRIEHVFQINNVLSHPQYSSIRRKFMAKARNRVNFLLGDFDSPDSICFKPFFNKAIYSSIAYGKEHIRQS